MAEVAVPGGDDADDLPTWCTAWFAAHAAPALGMTVRRVVVPPDGTSDDVAVVHGARAGVPCRVVVRRDARADSVVPRVPVAAQADLLGVLAAHGLPVPAVLLRVAGAAGGRDAGAVGGPDAVVLAWVEGETPRAADGFAPHGSLGRLGPDGSRRAAAATVDALARLHAVAAPGGVVGAPAGAPGGARVLDLAPHRLVAALTAMLAAAPDPPGPATAAALDRLRRTAPAAPADPVLCWGDARAANVVHRGDRVVGLLDWEHAGGGARALDVAWLAVTSAYFRRLARALGGAEAGAAYGRDALCAAYEDASGHPLRALPWYEAHAALRLRALAGVVPRLARQDAFLRARGLPALGDVPLRGADP